MARPRVFLSSTYYDLKHIRADLERFIESLGFEPILSEKGHIAYLFDQPLDESCYREARDADIFVLLIGGRYGSAASDQDVASPAFYDRYDSITRKEYAAAIARGSPAYVLVDKPVYADLQTFQRNRERVVAYAHVDNVGIFELLEEVLGQTHNNALHAFETADDIQRWLRAQWAGLFCELLRNRGERQKLDALHSQMSELSEQTQTQKKYLEAVMTGLPREDAPELIRAEDKRLTDSRLVRSLQDNPLFEALQSDYGVSAPDAAEDLIDALSFEDFLERLRKRSGSDTETKRRGLRQLLRNPQAPDDFTRARELFSLPPVPARDAGSVSD
jgi:hypothetical protein